ncbi:hypothetical protein EJB05_27595, partial [Eragrostis curvula]
MATVATDPYGVQPPGLAGHAAEETITSARIGAEACIWEESSGGDQQDCRISLYLEKETGFMKVFDTVVESQMDRRCTVVSLGGGVTGDVWVCSCCVPRYGVSFRGTPYSDGQAEAEARRAMKRTIEKNMKIKKTIDCALSPSFSKKKGESIWMVT